MKRLNMSIALEVLSAPPQLPDKRILTLESAANELAFPSTLASRHVLFCSVCSLRGSRGGGGGRRGRRLRAGAGGGGGAVRAGSCKGAVFARAPPAAAGVHELFAASCSPVYDVVTCTFVLPAGSCWLCDVQRQQGACLHEAATVKPRVKP